LSDPSNIYTNPHHNPLASTTDVQQKELPWYVPPDAGTPHTTVPAPQVPWGRGMAPSAVLPFLRSSASGDFLLNLIFVGILWELWICLYPIPAFAGLLTLLWSMPVLRSVLPVAPVIGPGLYAVIGGFVLAMIVLWTLSRWEHRLATYAWYRVPRHIVRLVLLGFAAALLLQKYMGLPYNPSQVGVVFRNPENIAIVAGAVVVAHFALWNWTWGRNFWHRRLEGARLRKGLS
jgi:hypothetical protein